MLIVDNQLHQLLQWINLHSLLRKWHLLPWSGRECLLPLQQFHIELLPMPVQRQFSCGLYSLRYGSPLRLIIEWMQFASLPDLGVLELNLHVLTLQYINIKLHKLHQRIGLLNMLGGLLCQQLEHNLRPLYYSSLCGLPQQLSLHYLPQQQLLHQ